MRSYTAPRIRRTRPDQRRPVPQPVPRCTKTLPLPASDSKKPRRNGASVHRGDRI